MNDALRTENSGDPTSAARVGSESFAPTHPPLGGHTVSLVRLLPAWFHAIADYAVAAALIIVASVAGGSGKAVGAGVAIGVVVLAVSMLTRYPLGVIKVLPFPVHSAGDYLASALLVLSPFALNFDGSDGGLTAFYIVAGAAVLLVSLVTNYQYSPKHSWAAGTSQPQVV
jgi:hypothetical protein